MPAQPLLNVSPRRGESRRSRKGGLCECLSGEPRSVNERQGTCDVNLTRQPRRVNEGRMTRSLGIPPAQPFLNVSPGRGEYRRSRKGGLCECLSGELRSVNERQGAIRAVPDSSLQESTKEKAPRGARLEGNQPKERAPGAASLQDSMSTGPWSRKNDEERRANAFGVRGARGRRSRGAPQVRKPERKTRSGTADGPDLSHPAGILRG
jgi:hypothetical protein